MRAGNVDIARLRLLDLQLARRVHQHVLFQHGPAKERREPRLHRALRRQLVRPVIPEEIVDGARVDLRDVPVPEVLLHTFAAALLLAL